MTIKLLFEPSASGQLEGINDAGIETFSGDHLGSLVREQGQNSMDARADKAKGPVDVSYTLISMPVASLPGATELESALKKIKAFWSEEGRQDKKAQKAAERALKILEKKTVPVLRISDRNTTGLRGSDLTMAGDWCGLTKSSGVSLKGEGKLGSFGIGKNVFWANSRLRMVYFATQDVDGLWAFQGVAKWASHRLNKKDISRAIGFCGEEKGFAPVRGKRNIPAAFRPNGVGTDIYLAGFEAQAEASWKEKLIAEFARNFFVSFHKDLLRVRIDDQELSSANIAAVIEGLAQDSALNATLKNFYDALVSPEAVEFTKEFDRLGGVKLRLLLREGATKSIAMFRGTGMMIFEKKHFRTPLQFSGVCICDNKKGNEFLRRLEPPSHNAWEPERYEDDPDGARDEIYNHLYKWLRECVNQLSPAAASESLDVPDLERFLPDEDDEVPLDRASGEKEGDPRTEEHTLEGRVRKERHRHEIIDQAEKEVVEPGEDEGDAGGGSGNLPGGGSDSVDGGDSRTNGGGPEGRELEPIPVRYRIFRKPGAAPVYVMRAELPGKGAYSLLVAAVGDDGNAEPMRPLVAVQKVADGKDRALVVSANARLTGIEVQRAGPATVEVQIPSRVPLSLSARFFKHG